MRPENSADSSNDSLLYRWHDVLVTERWFHGGDQWYPVTELQEVTWRSGPAHGARRRALVVIAAVTALVATTVAIALPSPWAVVAGTVYLILVGACVGLSLRRWPRPLLLCARYHGRPVVLHTSTDDIEFHKIHRALRRAAERHEDHILTSGSGLGK
jgi:hypothetical protein